MTFPKSHVVELVTSPEALNTIHDALDEVWSHHQTVPESIRSSMATAATEIAANIIEHTGRSNAVRLRMETHVIDDRVKISFSDDGPPVDVSLDSVRMPDPLADRGRGLALAKQSVSELSYQRIADGNCWTLLSERFG